MKTSPKKAPKKAPKPSAKGNAKLERREEVLHKDLDHDGEKGESAAHKAKVLSYSKERQLQDSNKKGKK